MKQIVVGFGLLIAALLILFRIARFNQFQSGFSTETYNKKYVQPA